MLQCKNANKINVHKCKNQWNEIKEINEVNDVLRDLCTIDSFVFFNNTNLSDCDICEDLLHLNYSGICKLASSLIVAINRNLEKK